MIFNANESSTAPIRRYLHGPGVDQILAEENVSATTGQTTEVYWALSDHLGTIRDRVIYNDVNGLVRWTSHFVFDSFGNLIAEVDPVTGTVISNARSLNHQAGPILSFTGREWDTDLGLYYYRARWYDPGTGQFLSEDPIFDDTTNTYRYVGNSPTNATDPSGLQEVSVGQKDEEAFRAALMKNGVEPAIIDIIIETARETPEPSRNLIGSHQVCADWVFDYERRLEEKLKKALPPLHDGMPRLTFVGVRSRKYVIFDIPLEATGNSLDDISWLNKNWILPTLIDFMNSGGPARNGSTNGLVNNYPSCDPMAARKWWLGQMHTLYRFTLADGSIWYVDVGTLQRVRASEAGVDDVSLGEWRITPEPGIPDDWIPTDRTADPSWGTQWDR